MVVEADAIKNSDSISRSLSRMNSVRSSPDLLKYVHEYSTMAAETLLINAGSNPAPSATLFFFTLSPLKLFAPGDCRTLLA